MQAMFVRHMAGVMAIVGALLFCGTLHAQLTFNFSMCMEKCVLCWLARFMLYQSML